MGGFVEWAQDFAAGLGGPGLFFIAFLDSSFLSLPEINDLLLVWMVTRHESRMLYYATCSTLGSIAGCLVLYHVGRRADQWVIRRFSQARINRAMATFHRYGVMAILIPSLLPPPAPFKIFVLIAGIAGIRLPRFVAAIAIGRGLRYFTEGLLALWYGDQAMAFIRENSRPVALVVAAVVVAGFIVYLVSRRRGQKHL
jgi:membrane protein YqaA with SNARE-associated domain